LKNTLKTPIKSKNSTLKTLESLLKFEKSVKTLKKRLRKIIVFPPYSKSKITEVTNIFIAFVNLKNETEVERTLITDLTLSFYLVN
jgi:hypothetical protein